MCAEEPHILVGTLCRFRMHMTDFLFASFKISGDGGSRSSALRSSALRSFSSQWKRKSDQSKIVLVLPVLPAFLSF